MEIAVLEGILFVVGEEGITLEEISKIMELELHKIKELLNLLKEEYSKDERGITLEEFGNRYKLTTKNIHKRYYERMVIEENNKELSESALETLAIIAYNEPITRSQIDEIRGVDTSYILRKLLLRDLIKDLGRSDLPGKPILYGITSKFLDYFGLKSKNELPEIIMETKTNEEINLFESRYKEN